jgi:hypothetical protein
MVCRFARWREINNRKCQCSCARESLHQKAIRLLTPSSCVFVDSFSLFSHSPAVQMGRMIVSALLALAMGVVAVNAATNCAFAGSLGNYDMSALAGKDYSGTDSTNTYAYTVAICGAVSEQTCKQAKSGQVANGCACQYNKPSSVRAPSPGLPAPLCSAARSFR